MLVQAGMGLIAVSLATLMAIHGHRKKSLSTTGALAAFLVGVLHFSSGLRFGAVLIAFYLSSSKLTKWRGDLKARLEADHVEGGRRTAAQVLANSLGGALLALASRLLHQGAGGQAAAAAAAAGCTCGGLSATEALLGAAFVGFYACCCADTWSSEVGIASKASPRLVTTLRAVPPGTNGAVSLLGTAAAAAGGLLMGVTYYLCQLGDAYLGMLPCSPAASRGDAALLISLAAAAGLLGSLLDSLLGATVQYSGFDERTKKATSGRPRGEEAQRWVKHTGGRDLLSNTGVNVVSSLVTSAAAAIAVRLWCGV